MSVDESVLGRAAFEFVGEPVSWADVIEVARIRGDWDRFTRSVSANIASLLSADEGEGEPTNEEIREAKRAFRNARQLLSAEDMAAWLGQWGMSVADWEFYMRMAVAGERRVSVLGGGAGGESEPDERIADVVTVAAICSGTLERWAIDLAERLAVSVDAGVELDVDSLDAQALANIDQAFESFCVETRGSGTGHELEPYILEWTRITVRGVFSESAGVIKEIVLSLSEGETLAELADEADLPVTEEAFELGSVDVDLRNHLSGAQVGDAVGPLDRDGRYWAGVVTNRERPTLDNPEIAERIYAQMLRRRLNRVVRDRILWRRPDSGSTGDD
jgi:hypothetical protein